MVSAGAAAERAAADKGSPPAARETSWQSPSGDEIRREVLAWLGRSSADPAKRRQAEALWPAEGDPSAATDPLAQLVQTFALVDARVQALFDYCQVGQRKPPTQKMEWLTAGDLPPFVAKNLQLFYGRWLAQQLLFDEARVYLLPLKAKEVVDPATLLFYQAVISHALLDRDPGLESIRLLLARSEQSPRRYVAVARLMQGDLEALKEDSLDHIARRMDDIRRRLDLGRAGPKVQQVENGVIESLDKLIKKLEDQQQQQQAAAGASGGSQSNTPAQDSRPMEGKGAGDVVKRNIGSKSGWGNLPPKEREEAIQQVSRDFPPHYREVIEQYFRKLATESSP